VFSEIAKKKKGILSLWRVPHALNHVRLNIYTINVLLSSS